MPSEIELTTDQESIIQGLSNTCKSIGIGYSLLLVAHSLDLISELQGGWTIISLLKLVKNIIVSAYIAKSLIDGSQEFEAIFKTKGNDTTHLVKGIKGVGQALARMKTGVYIMAAVTAFESISDIMF
eukprot:CFRG4058T1